MSCRGECTGAQRYQASMHEPWCVDRQPDEAEDLIARLSVVRWLVDVDALRRLVDQGETRSRMENEE